MGAYISKKITKAHHEMEALIERYSEAVEELPAGIRETMLLIHPFDPVAPRYIAEHLPEPIHIPHSWATGIGSTVGKKTSKRDKLIQFLEMESDDYDPLAKFKATMSDNVAVHTPATFDFNKPRKQWSHELFDNPKKK